MNALVSNFVRKVQTKHLETLQRRTNKLDPLERETLLEFLEDNLGQTTGREIALGAATSITGVDVDDDDEEEDYELLQRDLDKAQNRLEDLQSRRDFLHTRLASYTHKIEAAEESIRMRGGDQRLGEKVEVYKESLRPVQEVYRGIEEELAVLAAKIRSMLDRQLELRLKTQECRAVLQELAGTGTLRDDDVDIEGFELPVIVSAVAETSKDLEHTNANGNDDERHIASGNGTSKDDSSSEADDSHCKEEP